VPVAATDRVAVSRAVLLRCSERVGVAVRVGTRTSRDGDSDGENDAVGAFAVCDVGGDAVPLRCDRVDRETEGEAEGDQLMYRDVVAVGLDEAVMTMDVVGWRNSEWVDELVVLPEPGAAEALRGVVSDGVNGVPVPPHVADACTVGVGDAVSVNGGRGTGRSSSNGLDHRGTNHTDTPSNTIPPKKFPPPSVVF
jgi:hypothetical protein